MVNLFLLDIENDRFVKYERIAAHRWSIAFWTSLIVWGWVMSQLTRWFPYDSPYDSAYFMVVAAAGFVVVGMCYRVWLDHHDNETKRRTLLWHHVMEVEPDWAYRA